MIIKSIAVKNFRAILDESVDCADLTVLVGRNGAGKSSFLRALEMFYDPAAVAVSDDFYAEDVSKEIEITVTFSSLEAAEKEFFEPYLEGDDLTVSRVFALTAGRKSGTYHGSRLQNPAFIPIRTAAGKREILNKYKEVREQPPYDVLPTARTADDAEQAMKTWETANPTSAVNTEKRWNFLDLVSKVATTFVAPDDSGPASVLAERSPSVAE